MMTCHGMLCGTASSPPTIASLGLDMVNLLDIYTFIHDGEIWYDDGLEEKNNYGLAMNHSIWCLGRERVGATRAKARQANASISLWKLYLYLCICLCLANASIWPENCICCLYLCLAKSSISLSLEISFQNILLFSVFLSNNSNSTAFLSPCSPTAHIMEALLTFKAWLIIEKSKDKHERHDVKRVLGNISEIKRVFF